ncbi:cysteine--tRNA ligase [Marinicrinis sediminis]|uniref:Cysteine--tRNA ligase n=1 Tax=Marinicrinis sediminis TaxID=1652465 RepID=A0ABW5REM8_9BACL
MTLSIYNTMSRQKEVFIPLEEGKVKMYVCGPTVYDHIHIGNARPVIFFDVVRKYLERIGYEVAYVQNVTDVDDKLIRKAQEQQSSVKELSRTYAEAFFEDLDALGVRRATVHPTVTDHMEQIIAFIAQLEQEGYAYENGGDVFFRTERFEEYGKLSHQKIEELQHGIRIEVDQRKENPQDFVLWKQAKENEISWESPWGAGRPGWHIECSAMAKAHLGETMDIHGGGQDLTFPHHECEIAQSEALHDQPFARYWMHNGYIHFNHEKMSKSLGNGVNVVELRQRVKPAAIRYFMLSSHYRSPLNYSEEALQQAEQSVSRMENCWTNLQYACDHCEQQGDEGLEQVKPAIEAAMHQFDLKMKDDFNTPDAITAMFQLVQEINQALQQPEQLGLQTLQFMQQAFQDMNEVLGLLPMEEEALLDEQIEQLLTERIEARKAKNYARSDEIRDLLQEQGILLEDTPQGTRWRRK